MTPEEIKKHNDAVLSRDWSPEFIKKMMKAILLSHEKYGWMSQTYPELAQAIKCIPDRIDAYNKTHNKDNNQCKYHPNASHCQYIRCPCCTD